MIIFAESVILLNAAADPQSTCPNITIQVTDDCCLNCSYCYQINKGHRMMSQETMRDIIDFLFKMYDEDKPNTIINKHTKGIILEFMGGEPLMNIDLIHYGSKYFIEQCIQKNHPWLTNFKFDISSNGVLYFEPKFQEYLKEFGDFLSLNISIDGPKELHDTCRKDYNGNGSFDKSIAAFKDWQKNYTNNLHTKITIAPENLQYLNEIVDFFLNQNCIEFNANPINEHQWTIEESQLYYQQLKQMADKLLINNKYIRTNIFDELYGFPQLTSNNNNFCGGTGAMLAFDVEGKAYPCVRYMSSSLGDNQKPLIIGDQFGIYNTEESQKIYKELKSITRKSQSTDECFNCSIASGCSWCSAWNYQQFGTCNKRSINLCWMHRAKSLANAYYFNKYYRSIGSEKRIPIYLERSIANKIISDEEYDMLLKLSFNN